MMFIPPLINGKNCLLMMCFLSSICDGSDIVSMFDDVFFNTNVASGEFPLNDDMIPIIHANA